MPYHGSTQGAYLTWGIVPGVWVRVREEDRPRLADTNRWQHRQSVVQPACFESAERGMISSGMNAAHKGRATEVERQWNQQVTLTINNPYWWIIFPSVSEASLRVCVMSPWRVSIWGLENKLDLIICEPIPVGMQWPNFCISWSLARLFTF